MTKNIVSKLVVKVKVDLTLWSAIKLRIAGIFSKGENNDSIRND